MKRPVPTSSVRLRETGSTDVLLHTGGWRVSVSPTLVEPSVATPGPCEGYNSTNLTNYHCGFDA